MPDLTPPTDAASINTPPDASYLIKGTELPTYDVNLDQTSKESGLSQEQIVQMGGMNPEQAVSDFTAATKGKVGLALSTFAGVKPEVATKVQTLADHYDTPYSFADKNQQDLQNSYEANSIYENLLEANPDGTLKHPMTAGWLSDPDKMIAAKDDVKAIQNIEDLTKEFHYKYDNDNFFNNLLLGIPGNVAAATVGAGEGIRDVAENADRVWNYNMARAFAPYFGLNDEETYKAEMAASQSVKEGFDAVLGSPTRDIEARKDWMQEASKGNFRPFVRSVGAGAPLMAAAVLQPELSPMLFGTTTFNSYFNRSMDRGDTEQAAMLNAGTQAIIAATLTPANLENNIVKALGAKGVGEMVTKTLAGSAGMEGIASLQEAVDFAYNNHSDISQLTDPKNVIDWVGRRIEGFFVNAALFGMMNGARGVQKQQDLHAMVDQAMNEMSTAKFATLKPELKNDLLGRVLTSAGVEDTAAVKATDVKTFFQDDPSGLGKFLERHQVDSEDFEDAVRNNGTVQTSASKLLASQEDAPLVARVGAGNIAIGEGGMTADEIQAKTKEIQSRIQELGDQVKDAKIGKRENPAWVEQTINTLMKSKAQGGEGWDAKTAAQSVLLLHHTLENFAQISGEDTGAMYKRLGIETKVDRSGRQLAEGEIAQPDKKTLGQKVIDALTGK